MRHTIDGNVYDTEKTKVAKTFHVGPTPARPKALVRQVDCYLDKRKRWFAVFTPGFHGETASLRVLKGRPA
jgi:hypothetical protein